MLVRQWDPGQVLTSQAINSCRDGTITQVSKNIVENVNNTSAAWLTTATQSVVFSALSALHFSLLYTFYRAMHFSANARSWDRMSSVCPSVTLVICDHIRWKSWKLIARTISPTPSLFAAKRRFTYSQGNMGYFGETRGGVGKKWHAGEQKRQYLWNA